VIYRGASNALVGIVDQAATELHWLRKTLHQLDPPGIGRRKAILGEPSTKLHHFCRNCARNEIDTFVGMGLIKASTRTAAHI
jgi:hypothetical protein